MNSFQSALDSCTVAAAVGKLVKGVELPRGQFFLCYNFWISNPALQFPTALPVFLLVRLSGRKKTTPVSSQLKIAL